MGAMSKPATHQFVRCPGLPHLELRTATGSRDCYQTHSHDEYSFGTIDAGRAIYTYGAHNTALKPGMTVMMEPGLAHACNPEDHQAWSYRMLFVDAQWVHQSFLPLAYAPHPPRLLFAQHATDEPAVYEALGRIAEALAGRSADVLEVDEWLLTFLAKHVLVPRVAPTQPDADEQVLNAVRALICAQVECDLTLAQLAQASGWSGYQLIRKFKRAFGQTPHAFQIDQRLNRAKTLLKQGAGLSDVAHQLGFADQAHFQRHFRKRHATTPKNYLGSVLSP
jgi:AraC-like DNA-binding protein